MIRTHSPTVLVCIASLAIFATFAQATEWSKVRDGVIYIRSHKPVTIECRWEAAWAADGHMETLYFQDPAGQVLERRRIGFKETSGSETFETTKKKGDYRLEIPGRSYRYYSVEVPDKVSSVFEPVKHHHAANVQSGVKLFFHVPEGKVFTVCGKYHGGADWLEIGNGDGVQGMLDLTAFGEEGYHRFDSLKFDAQAHESMWWLRTKGSGKVGFWLDGIENLFALDPGQWFDPRREDGNVEIRIRDETRGQTPLVGATLPFAHVPEQGLDLLAELKMSFANCYSFQEAYKSRAGAIQFHDIAWLEAYDKRLGLKEVITIFEADRNEYKRRGKAPSAREAGPYIDYVSGFLSAHRGDNGLSLPYAAFMDEGNLRYSDAEAYASFFSMVANAMRQSDDYAVSSVKLGFPESSGFLNGPTKKDAASRRGIDWLRVGLEAHWDLIDAITWHEWMLRDLIATEWFAESVEAAWALQEEFRPKDAEAKEIIIAQTNISSGNTMSGYEEDTFFAALWLASVVARAGGTGKLKAINWLPAFDEKTFKKGLIAHDGKKGAFKPVAHGMRFVNEHLLPHVLDWACGSAEVDVLPMYDNAGAMHILMVNKARRAQNVRLQIDLPKGMRKDALVMKLTCLDASLDVKITSEQKSKAASTFERDLRLAAETIYFLSLAVL